LSHRRARRDEWTEAGVFDPLKTQAFAAIDEIVASTSRTWPST